LAEHTHTLTTHVDADAVWDFVRDMDQWAPFLLGYQAHDKRSESESIWTIKGDVGTLTRTVDFRVQITEWNEPDSVRFTLEGTSEPLRGEGSFRIDLIDPAEAAAAVTAAESPRPGFFVRLWAALVRRLLGRGDASAARSGAASAPPSVRLTFRLSLTPGGAMAPMINSMIKPVMVATAEDLAQRIVAHLETRAA
jgi:carbon monoxide dehydrogenase subunit G